MCQVETRSDNRKNDVGKTEKKGENEKKVDKVTGSMNVSIDGRESQVNKERVNQ